MAGILGKGVLERMSDVYGSGNTNVTSNNSPPPTNQPSKSSIVSSGSLSRFSDIYGISNDPTPTPQTSNNLLDQAGGLVNKGVSFVQNYFKPQQQPVQPQNSMFSPLGVGSNVSNTPIGGTATPKQNKVMTETTRFGARTAVGFADLISESLDYITDYVANNLVNKKQPQWKFVADANDKWLKYYGEQSAQGNIPTQKLKNFVDSLQESNFIKSSPEWEKSSTKEKLTTKLGETILNLTPSVLSSAAAFVINPTLGFVVSATSTANDVKDLGVEYGLPNEKAEKLGLVTGLLVGALDKIVPDEVLKGDVKKKFIGGFTKRLVKSTLTTAKEAGTEMLQEDIQLIAEKTFREDLGWDEVKTRNTMAGLGGLFGGFGFSLIGNFSDTTVKKDILGRPDFSGGTVSKDVGEEMKTTEPVKLPSNIDENVSKTIQELNTIDANNPITGEDTIRVYQTEGKGEAGKTKWVFSNPEELADYMSKSDPTATARFIDIKQSDLTAHPERGSGVFTIEDSSKILNSSDKLVEPVAETITEKRQVAKTKEYVSQKATLPIKSLMDTKGEVISDVSAKIPEGEVSVTKGAIDVVKTKDGYMVLNGQNLATEALVSGKKNIRSNILTAKEALAKYGARLPQLKSVLNVPSPKKRPATKIKEDIAETKTKIEEKQTEATGVAEVAKDKRQGLNTKDIGNLKRIYFKSQKFQEGDIETIRASNSGKLLDRVIEDVQIKFPGMTEEEAFDYAMTLPVKSDESVKRLPEIADLKGKLKQIESEYDAYVKKNGLAVGVRKKAIKNGLRMSFGDMPEYEMVNIDEQTDEALKLLVADKTYALDIALGKVDPPPGLLPESVFIAVENDALSRGDTDVLRQLATESALVSDATAMGQRIRMLAERNPYSPTSAMDKVAKVRKSNIEEKTGKKVSQLTKETVSDIQSEITKAQPKKSEWGLFIDSITCK